jgi:hypothetical protein
VKQKKQYHITLSPCKSKVTSKWELCKFVQILDGDLLFPIVVRISHVLFFHAGGVEKQRDAGKASLAHPWAVPWAHLTFLCDAHTLSRIWKKINKFIKI